MGMRGTGGENETNQGENVPIVAFHMQGSGN